MTISSIPNLALDEVPVGKDESSNKEIKKDLRSQVLFTASDAASTVAYQQTYDRIAQIGLKNGWLFRDATAAMPKYMNAKQITELRGLSGMRSELEGLFVDNYADDISTIINEIEKHFLFNNNQHIDFNLSKDNLYNSKHIKIWNLLDALGKKDINKSIAYYNNLYINGTSLVFILINLNNLYFEIYNTISNNKISYSSLNKILQSNLKTYSRKYSSSEIAKIFIILKDLDVTIKTSSLNEEVLFSSLIIKICNNYYG